MTDARDASSNETPTVRSGREPRATYRLQMHAGFTFADALEAMPYFAELGISHLYLSPVLSAAEGSTHGYDVVDPENISKVLGGEEGLEKLADAAHAVGIGLLLDIVPNHMSIAGSGNRWWFDVLENGPSSYYSHYFDVDWGIDDRIVLPVLTERYGRAIQNGAIRIADQGNGTLALKVGDGLELPLAPRSVGMLVRRAADRIKHPELAFIGDALSELPSLHSRDADARRRRHRDKRVLYARLATLIDLRGRKGEDDALRARESDPRHARALACSVALADEIAAVNSDPAELDAILEKQAYRLAHWSVAANQLSYRRFFDINTLAGIRNEDPDVFEASHGKILELFEAGIIDGMRIDHVDGLRDPEAYLTRLHERAPGSWVVVEKILTAGETLPQTWPIDGTTGYEFMERLGGFLVDPASERSMTRLFEDFTGTTFEPGAHSRKARIEVMSDALHSELSRLTELAVRACAQSPTCRDYTRVEIETALAEILAGFPTYRIYLRPEHARSRDVGDQDDLDRARLTTAIVAARDNRPDLDRDLLAFLESALAFDIPSEPALELAHSAQQVTGAITAKGDEDTVLYRQVRLLARCDVGAELRQYSHSPTVVHHHLATAKPRTLLATSTHDSKRSEDVRARIAVLSEMPDAWAAHVRRWSERATKYWQQVPPDRVMEYTLWQTLVGAWPIPADRVKQYSNKASREARLRTSWRKPDDAYDKALVAWIDGVYGDRELLADIERFASEIEPHGDRNSLAQLLVKLTAPGVPDFYQGTELRDDSLVDPDNRRPVDLAVRSNLLRELTDAKPHTLPDLSARKLWTIRRVLGLRRKQPVRFLGAYHALVAAGPHADRVFAYARGTELVTIVPRLGVGAQGWRDTTLELPAGSWLDVLTDQTIAGGNRAVSELWRAFPVALLTRI